MRTNVKYVCCHCKKKIDTDKVYYEQSESPLYIEQFKDREVYWCNFCWNNASIRPR